MSIIDCRTLDQMRNLKLHNEWVLPLETFVGLVVKESGANIMTKTFIMSMKCFENYKADQALFQKGDIEGLNLKIKTKLKDIVVEERRANQRHEAERRAQDDLFK